MMPPNKGIISCAFLARIISYAIPAFGLPRAKKSPAIAGLLKLCGLRFALSDQKQFYHGARKFARDFEGAGWGRLLAFANSLRDFAG